MRDTPARNSRAGRRKRAQVEYANRTHQTLKIEGFGGFAPRAGPRARATGGAPMFTHARARGATWDVEP